MNALMYPTIFAILCVVPCVHSAYFRRSGDDDCKAVGSACDGMPNCCGDAVCYFEGGVSTWDLFRDGECVTCIQAGQSCQRDVQCCQDKGLACIREKIYAINGVCQEKLGEGGHCHYGDDCRSGDCEREYLISLHGRCGPE